MNTLRKCERNVIFQEITNRFREEVMVLMRVNRFSCGAQLNAAGSL